MRRGQGLGLGISEILRFRFPSILTPAPNPPVKIDPLPDNGFMRVMAEISGIGLGRQAAGQRFFVQHAAHGCTGSACFIAGRDQQTVDAVFERRCKTRLMRSDHGCTG